MIDNKTTDRNASASTTQSDWSTAITAVSSIDYVLITIAILLHLLGIAFQFITYKSKKMPNQNILLVNLSFVSFFSIGTNAFAVDYKSKNIFFPPDFITVFYVAYMSYILSLIMLTFDRVTFVLLNLRYDRFIQRPVIIAAILTSWIASISYGLVLRYAKFNRTQYFKYAHHGFNGFTCAFAATCYIVILVTVFFSSRGLRKNKTSSTRMLKKFLVPFILVMSFFTFQYLPSILTAHVTFKNKDENRLFVIGLIGVNILNSVSDPLCYILLQPKIKKKVKRMISKPTLGSENRTYKLNRRTMQNTK